MEENKTYEEEQTTTTSVATETTPESKSNAGSLAVKIAGGVALGGLLLSKGAKYLGAKYRESLRKKGWTVEEPKTEKKDEPIEGEVVSEKEVPEEETSK